MSETNDSTIRPHKRTDAQQLDDALTRFDGDRQKAAASLGITVEQIKARLYYNKDLQVKWSTTGQKVRKAIGAEDNPVGVIEKMVSDAYISLNVQSNSVLGDIKRLRERLMRGEEARFSDDPEMVKFRFRFNDKGEPVEEMMLWDNLNRLYDTFLKHTVTFQDGMETKVKLQLLIQKAKAEASQQRGGMRKLKPGFKPKGQIAAPIEISEQPPSETTT